MSTVNTYAKKRALQNEDWWAAWLGLLIFALGLGPFFGMDILGWVTKSSVWIDPAKAFAPVTKGVGISGFASLLATYVFILVLIGVASKFIGANMKKFFVGFTFIFWMTTLCLMIGNIAYIGATPDKTANYGIAWSLGLGEMGYIIAMVIGLIIGNFFLKFADYLKEAAKPELFIKIGIVVLGGSIALKSLDAFGLATTVIIRGICAVVEAYLIYWPVVYLIARKFFKFTPEWAAPLASGISICGVSAAIATGSAIRARPVIPIILSAVIIVFVAVELLLLPWLAQALLFKDPMVAGAWMGLAVKSDGGAIAAGAITDSLIRGRALSELGVNWEEGWILMVATTTKVFIDIFIGVWAFILAVIWSVFPIDKNSAVAQTGERGKVNPAEIWNRFPKFIIGFVLTFVILFLVGVFSPDDVSKLKPGVSEANALRTFFFGMCFFSIGLVTNVRKLWDEGMGRIVAVYGIALFGFILWVGLFISWLFYHGITPPTV
ncbi:MAG: putative sulfate exporter family transporter [Desulfitobacterium sp.]